MAGYRPERFSELTEFVVVDTETTGLDTEQDRVVEVAAIRMGLDRNSEHWIDPGDADIFHRHFDPGFSMPAEAQAVHGITVDRRTPTPH